MQVRSTLSDTTPIAIGVAVRAVWSFWSKPYARHRHLPTDFHYALTWSLSILEAREHYPDTWLYTDDRGARLLVDELQLPFEHVSTELNDLIEYDAEWWALGKIHTYRQQTEPFVHIDNDVFLWLPLPDELTQAGVFAQNPEPFSHSHYQPERIEAALAPVNGWLPEEWTWYRASGQSLRGECCGIYGGTRLDFIRYTADLAFELLLRPSNRAAMAQVSDKAWMVMLLEQFLPAACLEYHRSRAESPFQDVSISYLFASAAELFHPEHAARTGFTHLFSAKGNRRVLKVLERRLRLIDPAQYERCRKIDIEDAHFGW